MKIANFEHTGLDKIEVWIEKNEIRKIDEISLKEVLRNVNLSFGIEGINRVQSTLICELKDSYVQQSQRYVIMDKDSYILPVMEEKDLKNAVAIVEKTFDLYERMSRLKEGDFKGRPKMENYLYGIPIEDARYILPLATKTNVSVSMSGDKLFELFRLLTNRKYVNIFSELRDKIETYLPRNLLNLLPRSYDGGCDDKIIESFYFDDIAKIGPENNIILLDHFGNLDLKVGLGALTSTLSVAPSEKMAIWGEEASAKAKNVAQRVLGYGHESIAEQARTTFGMMCSMVTYHQQIRHRLSENHREDLCELILDTERPVIVPKSIKVSMFYQEYMELVAEVKLFRLYLGEKYEMEKSFSLLLNCDQIKVIISTNARIDISILADRICMNSQWEIRELATKKMMILRNLSNVLYEKALPTCVYSKCREGKLTCGKQGEIREKFLNKD